MLLITATYYCYSSEADIVVTGRLSHLVANGFPHSSVGDGSTTQAKVHGPIAEQCERSSSW